MSLRDISLVYTWRNILVMVLNGKHEAIIASFVCLQHTGFLLLYEQRDTLGVSVGSSL